MSDDQLSTEKTWFLSVRNATYPRTFMTADVWKRVTTCNHIDIVADGRQLSVSVILLLRSKNFQLASDAKRRLRVPVEGTS